MVSVVSIRGFMATSSFEEGESVYKPLRFLYAITTGFLWLRVLSFLKAINMQLATFVLAILQVSDSCLSITSDSAFTQACDAMPLTRRLLEMLCGFLSFCSVW